MRIQDYDCKHIDSTEPTDGSKEWRANMSRHLRAAMDRISIVCMFSLSKILSYCSIVALGSQSGCRLALLLASSSAGVRLHSSCRS